jgi:hypothetical protein
MELDHNPLIAQVKIDPKQDYQIIKELGS